MRFFNKELHFSTDQNNLLDLEPKLAPHLQDIDYFSIIDLTEQSKIWVQESQINNGLLTVQALHTTCIISINELDEPCLLGDINNTLRDFIPKTKSYLHNGPIRTKNLCEDDYKCDRNADAHIKAFLYGSASQTVIIKEGKPQWGQWQRLCLIDFDGPRKRKVMIQIIGE
jgi:secondary thiamine-phosphate synthase enzyme